MTTATANDLATRLGQALAELTDIATAADEAWRAIADAPPEYSTYAREQAAEMTRLASIARAARIAAGDINLDLDPTVRHADDNV